MSQIKWQTYKTIYREISRRLYTYKDTKKQTKVDMKGSTEKHIEKKKLNTYKDKIKLHTYKKTQKKHI